MSIQEALKMLRLELGITQADLAGKINKAYITVNRWENGKAFPSRSNAQDILAVAKAEGASEDCISYLNEVLLPDCRRSQTGSEYGFPEIDREFLFLIADNSDNATYVVDSKTFKILYANRTAEKIAQRGREESGKKIGAHRLEQAKNRQCYNYFLGFSEPCFFCPLQNLKNLDSWKGVIKSPESRRTYNADVKRAKLHEKEVYIIYLSDITDVAREREALYEMTNDITDGVGIYQLYFDGRKELVFMNSAYYKMIGSALKEQMLTGGVTDLRLVHPDDVDRLNTEIENAIAGKRNIETDFRMKIRDGEYHMVHLFGRKIKEDTEKYTFYCVFTEYDSVK